jgi:hypothetical protein
VFTGADIRILRTPVHAPRANAMVAVGTALEGGPPLRSQRAGLPHWAPASGSDGQALGRERVHHAGWWEPSSSK